jgi:hypothetical protein
MIVAVILTGCLVRIGNVCRVVISRRAGGAEGMESSLDLREELERLLLCSSMLVLLIFLERLDGPRLGELPGGAIVRVLDINHEETFQGREEGTIMNCAQHWRTELNIRNDKG